MSNCNPNDNKISCDQLEKEVRTGFEENQLQQATRLKKEELINYLNNVHRYINSIHGKVTGTVEKTWDNSVGTVLSLVPVIGQSVNNAAKSVANTATSLVDSPPTAPNGAFIEGQGKNTHLCSEIRIPKRTVCSRIGEGTLNGNCIGMEEKCEVHYNKDRKDRNCLMVRVKAPGFDKIWPSLPKNGGKKKTKQLKYKYKKKLNRRKTKRRL
jgi:hypothetical protein